MTAVHSAARRAVCWASKKAGKMERSMAELTALTKAGLSAFRSVVSSAD
jgi:hypothetical protein